MQKKGNTNKKKKTVHALKKNGSGSIWLSILKILGHGFLTETSRKDRTLWL